MNPEALKARLKTISAAEQRSSQDVWRTLVLERFLVRLAHSNYSEQFIFKGGLLLAHYIRIGRETKDADFLATMLDARQENVARAFQEMAAVSIADGFSFSFSLISQLDQQHMNYPGFRVKLNVSFGSMKDKIHLDIGVGDVVEPNEKVIRLYQYRGEPIFEDSVSLQVYPVETIFAEKLETLVSRAAANSRMKDYHDLVLLCRQPDLLDTSKLKKDITETFQNRNTPLDLPVDFSEDAYAQLQTLWVAHLRVLGDIAEALQLPDQIEVVLTEINAWLSANAIV